MSTTLEVLVETLVEGEFELGSEFKQTGQIHLRAASLAKIQLLETIGVI